MQYVDTIIGFMQQAPAFIIANWRAFAGLALALTVAGIGLRASYRKDRG